MKFTNTYFLNLIIVLIIPFTICFNFQVHAANKSSNLPLQRKEPSDNQNTRNKPKVPKPVVLRPVKFYLPPTGAPGDRIPSSKRNECPKVSTPLTALIPQTNIGLTILSRPTFWFYVPYQPRSENQVEFLLFNEKDNLVYQTVFIPQNTPGIIRFTLPQNAPALESSKKYKWVFSYICNSNNRLRDVLVHGHIERIPTNSNLQNQLDKAKTIRERILLLAENGIWYDALTLLAEERRKKPKDAQVAQDWRDFLQYSSQDVELEKIVFEPIVLCCSNNR